jgi:2-C-methyl-D-erythritol 2,4-cyclodiphosphate synthase
MQNNNNFLRCGIGYDVHAFAENRKLILGGVEIPHTLGLLGHSDADVLTHAVADALLGAARAGDIGKLFPDTDPAYEGANSLELLAHVVNHISALGFEIVDCDCVVAAQSPKLSPHREQMRANLAHAMGIDVDNIGVKATTTEHLGFVGRSEGIAAWSTCILQKIPQTN